jgi:hypothetical protein
VRGLWRAGDEILLRHLFRGRVLIASPLRVVEHAPELLVYVAAAVDPVHATHAPAFSGWYVNLQDPLRPAPLGFDTRDHLLDP